MCRCNMCDLKEGQRHEKLAVLFLKEGNKAKAVEHYLEAAGIYVLNTELLKKEELISDANRCYNQVQHLRGEKDIKPLSKQELARRTLLEAKSHHHEHSHGSLHKEHDELQEIENLLK